MPQPVRYDICNFTSSLALMNYLSISFCFSFMCPVSLLRYFSFCAVSLVTLLLTRHVNKQELYYYCFKVIVQYLCVCLLFNS